MKLNGTVADPRYLTLFAVGLICNAGAAEAVTITSSSDDATVLANSLVGSGITVIGTPAYSAVGTTASGFFTNGTGSIGIESGVILTTGDAFLAEGPNSTDESGVSNDLPGDADLDVLAGAATADATVLEFDFQFGDGSTGGNLFFEYSFASEEYNEFVNGGFNDVFGLFVNGTNVAIAPDGQPASIDTINGGNPFTGSGPNSTFFNNNDINDGGPFFDVEYDGFTDVFVAQALGLPAGVSTLKLALADTGDSFFDSALFIEGNSVTDVNPNIVPFEFESGVGLAALAGLFGYRKWRRSRQKQFA